MNRFPCRCRKCGARRTLARRPEQYQREPGCSCGGTYRVDWYRRDKEHLRAACYCEGYPWAIDNAPHRRGSPECYYRELPDRSGECHGIVPHDSVGSF